MRRSCWLLMMIAVALPGLAPPARAITVTVPDDFATLQAVIDAPTFLVAGSHTVDWAAASAAPGVYFVRFRFPGGSAIQRLVMIP